MSTDLPICMGCFLNPGWHYSISVPSLPKDLFTCKPSSVSHSTEVPTGLTDGEKEILLLLLEVWNKFSSLPDHVGHDLNEFCYSIHMLQQKVALRVARRIDPLIWRQPDVKSETKEENITEAEGSQG